MKTTTLQQAFKDLSQTTEQDKNQYLQCLASLLWKKRFSIISQNQKDIHRAKKRNLSHALIERLVLDEPGIQKMMARLSAIQNLDAGLGETIEQNILENGVIVKKVRTALGIIGVIYEARPEVTVDVAALCIKSGNVAILKGGSEALFTNRAVFSCIQEALQILQMHPATITFLTKRAMINLLGRDDVLDLVIARGSYQMVKAVRNISKVPVLAHSAGGARIYIDRSADLHIAYSIVINAKISKPSACNSVDTVVVHKDIAKDFLPKLVFLLQQMNVTVLGDTYTSQLVSVTKAKKSDWDTEFLDLCLAIKVVSHYHEALRFIAQQSKKHSEAIIAENQEVIAAFTNQIDAAALFVNCSTRLHDGYVFGLGAEMGIATGKLHARGPVGLTELTTYKWEVYGTGQTRND